MVLQIKDSPLFVIVSIPKLQLIVQSCIYFFISPFINFLAIIPINIPVGIENNNRYGK